jgi:hypothetical protein
VVEEFVKLHLKEQHPLLYLSGTGTYGMGEKDIIKMGAKYRCYSYAYVCPGGFYYQKKMEEAMDISVKNGLGIMMDSGAHSFHKLVSAGLRKKSGKWNVGDMNKLRDQTVTNLARYYKKYGKDWDWYVTFDYIKDCPTIREMQGKLLKLGTKPVPVYHGDKPMDWFERYCKEGYKLICIGSVRRNNTQQRAYFDRCFNMAAKYGVLLHGLAVTSLTGMYSFPWYSVDSATWAKVAAFGCILCTSDTVNDTFGYLHVTDRRHGQSRGIEYCELSKVQKKAIEMSVNKDGFDMKELMEDGAKRSLYNIYVFCNKVSHLKADLAASKMRWKSLLV